MSEYYKMDFTSAEPLYAEVKESLKSYFDSGSVDDLMFPIWTDRCIKKFRRSLLKIEETALEIKDYETALPDNFKYVREIWLCTNINKYIQSPNAFYYQKDCRVTRVDDKCAPCFDENNEVVPILPCPNSTCNPCQDNYVVTHKRTNHAIISYNFKHLLRPGNISTKKHCFGDCSNLSSKSYDVFDIRDCKLITNFQSGWVHLTYYTDNYNEDQEIQIPDNVRIQDYIRFYITYKIFETLSNQTTDESLNQIMSKMAYYENKANEAYVLADIETKKETIWDVNKKIIQSHRRFRNYDIQ